MRLKAGENVRTLILNNLPCKKHAGCLTADHAGAEHALFNVQVILGLEILLYHDTKPFVACHHDVAHATALFRHIEAVFMHRLGHFEETVPTVLIAAIRARRVVLQKLIEMARNHAVKDRRKLPFLGLVPVWQEHRLGVAVPNLVRPHVDVRLVRVHVEEQLCRVTDLGDCLERVLAAN